MYSESVGRTSPGVPFWPSLTAMEQRALIASAERATLHAGTVLCSEAEPATQVIVILSGWTKVSLTRDSRERIIALRGPGDLVGERAALLIRSRSATVVALDTVDALLVPAETFAGFLDEHDRVLALLERQIYGRLTESPRGSPAGSDTSVEELIARHVADIALPRTEPGGRFTLPISRQELADWVDAPGSEVERILSSWERNGIASSLPYSLTILDAAALGRIGGGSPQMEGVGASHAAWAGQNCSILYTDVAAFSDHIRTDEDRRTVRRAMYETVRGAFEDSELPWARIYREDRGDGTLMVVPPSIPTSSLADPLLSHIGVRLDAYNREADDRVRIQLRVALDVGPVMPDPEGVSGEVIIQAARMLDARDFKAELADTGADLGFIVSQFVYDSVVKHGREVGRSSAYRQVEVRVKETETTAWMYLAHGARPLRGRSPVSQAIAPTSPGPSTGAQLSGTVDVRGDLVMGNKNQYRH
ncbi:Crp/Fnr family transcriptional regulator [Actinomadura sp. HBU206391]|uniref:Crp/Fnr family transcriptional regulator n=1 Tax=Actinomadura sp. HBU206391 TaxID=2731692 RepID=UPI00164F049A|nr:Crp/Fnr family transcriptional regulator [Actinomadura sp. HBU206391]